jgi:hypothetical protein
MVLKYEKLRTGCMVHGIIRDYITPMTGAHKVFFNLILSVFPGSGLGFHITCQHAGEHIGTHASPQKSLS